MTDEVLGMCRWKFGEHSPACENPAVTTYHISLPAEVMPGVVIAEDQREQDVPICERHEALIATLAKPDVFALKTSAQREGDLPIEGEHKAHKAWTADCLGCALDYDPPWVTAP